ncbi:MAG: serine/threonine-protein kinase [Acidobacteriota bacterium]
MADVLESVVSRQTAGGPPDLDDLARSDPGLARLIAAEIEEAEATEYSPRPQLTGRHLGMPEWIDGYRVLERLGTGGMGSVYLAERRDADFERRVAIKVLRAGFDVPETRSRFVSERQILADFDHPHIARLFDGGTLGDGRPYLVMEYVDGRPIDRYCDDEGLGVRGRVQLMLDVCSAVRYAHSRLVVHRDLKPSNILVTGDGTVKLLDFGIAKLLDPASFPVTVHATRDGKAPMTPHYASPEQIRGEPVTTGADVYSLGVVLYRLLSGRLPFRFDNSTPVAMLAALERFEPTRPSSAVEATGRAKSKGEAASARDRRRPLFVDGSPGRIAESVGVDPREWQRQLRGDLDNVVLNALHRDPNRRYATVGQLRDDLERHLEGRPVRARQDSYFYRLGKFIGRHRWPTALLAVLALALVAFAGFASRQASLVARERNAAVEAMARAERSRVETERARLAEAEVVDFMVELYRSADADLRGDALPTPKDLLDRGAARVEAELGARPQVQLRLMLVLARSYWTLGHYGPARELYEASLARLDDPDADFPLDLHLQALQGLAQVAFKQNALDESERLFTEVQRLLGESSADDLERRITAANGLASIHSLRGDPSTAAAKLRAVIELYGDGETPAGRLVDSHINLCAVLSSAGEMTQALEICRLGVEGAKQAPGVGPSLAAALDNYAGALTHMRRHDEALLHFKEALDIRRAELGEGHADTAHSYSNLGVVEYELGDFSRASALFARAADGLRQALGPDHPSYGVAILNLADTEERRGLVVEAGLRVAEAQRALGEGLDRGHYLLAVGEIIAGRQLHAVGDASAAARLEDAYRHLRGELGLTHHYTRLAAAERARIAADGGDWTEATAWSERALIADPDAGAELAAAEARYLATWVLGRIARAEGRTDAAGRLVDEAVALVEAHWYPDHLHVAAPLLTRAELAVDAGDAATARRLAWRLEAIYHRSVVPEHPGVQAVAVLKQRLDGLPPQDPGLP